MSALRPILIVDDDDAALRASLAERFSGAAGFDPDGAGTAAEAEAKLAAAGGWRRHHAVLLDAGLPDGNGRELCTRLREGGLKVPVVILAAGDANAEQDVVAWLDAGANDCVAKPVRGPSCWRASAPSSAPSTPRRTRSSPAGLGCSARPAGC